MELDNETNVDLYIWLTYKVMEIRLCELKDNHIDMFFGRCMQRPYILRLRKCRISM
ncbi:MAG: hypothetical protein LBM07_04980 [Culturomica sp.]|nr:hypothetical protein [Culturomica sp.]